MTGPSWQCDAGMLFGDVTAEMHAAVNECTETDRPGTTGTDHQGRFKSSLPLIAQIRS